MEVRIEMEEGKEKKEIVRRGGRERERESQTDGQIGIDGT